MKTLQKESSPCVEKWQKHLESSMIWCFRSLWHANPLLQRQNQKQTKVYELLYAWSGAFTAVHIFSEGEGAFTNTCTVSNSNTFLPLTLPTRECVDNTLKQSLFCCYSRQDDSFKSPKNVMYPVTFHWKQLTGQSRCVLHMLSVFALIYSKN